MLSLRPTSISISKSDLSFHLGQLDIYQGLLKQGFKKQDIIRYFKEQDAADSGPSQENLSSLQSARAASTVELTAATHDLVMGHDAYDDTTAEKDELSHHARNASAVNLHAASRAAAPSLMNDDDSASLKSESDFESTVAMRRSSRAHAPRQSSLLRFAHLPHSSSPDSGNAQLQMHSLSPRWNIKYRPRNQTYSYDHSEQDEQDFRGKGEDDLLTEIQHLALGSETVADIDHFVVSSPSSLRPQAEDFTPACLSAKLHGSIKTTNGEDDAKSPSLPSSPPARLQTPRHVSMSELPIPRTEPSRIRRQVDCSFAVYDDSLPPDTQPRTPDDVDHYVHLNPAYTAPPGSLMLHRTACSPQACARALSGDQSPTARALLMRGRRQREFDRGARVERLRIARMRQHDRPGAASPNEGRATVHMGLANEDLWRDDLDADRVGEENFDESGAWPNLLEVPDLRPVTDNSRIRN